jgi:hypothetical protein
MYVCSNLIHRRILVCLGIADNDTRGVCRDNFGNGGPSMLPIVRFYTTDKVSSSFCVAGCREEDRPKLRRCVAGVV